MLNIYFPNKIMIFITLRNYTTQKHNSAYIFENQLRNITFLYKFKHFIDDGWENVIETLAVEF